MAINERSQGKNRDAQLYRGWQAIFAKQYLVWYGQIFGRKDALATNVPLPQLLLPWAASRFVYSIWTIHKWMFHTRSHVCPMSMERLPQYGFHKWLKSKKVWARYGHLENRHILSRAQICIPDTWSPKQNFSDTGRQSHESRRVPPPSVAPEYTEKPQSQWPSQSHPAKASFLSRVLAEECHLQPLTQFSVHPSPQG